VAAEDRKLKLVLKDHDCDRIGEIVPYASFDAVSRVNDVGEATLVASYGQSARSNAVLDAMSVPDVILEAYIQPPGHDKFLDEPAWSGFLRNRVVAQTGPTRTVTATFKDYNHLLARRVVKPPPGASHDEGYGCTPDVMRDLVRRHCAELADSERQFPGLSVEPNECEESGGLYGADASLLVLGNNEPDWVRCNALISWNGQIYAGVETQKSTGTYGEIWRSIDGTGWSLVYSGDPTLIYGDDVTGIHCFAVFNDILYAGASTDYMDGDGIVLRSTDGQLWGVSEVFARHTAVWSLAVFDGNLYAGTSGHNRYDYTAEPSIHRSADGLVWADVDAGSGDVFALYGWGDYLYAGFSICGCEFGMGGLPSGSYYRATIRRSADGVTWNNVYVRYNRWGILCFYEGSDGNLYAGTGTHRFYYCHYFNAPCKPDVEDAWAAVLQSPDGAAWTSLGVVDAAAHGVTSLLEITADDGTPRLCAAVGGYVSGSGKIYATADWGTTWYCAFTPYVDYRYSLALVTHAGSQYAAFGSLNKTHFGPSPWTDFQADHGDVWRVVIPDSDVEESGTVARWIVLLDKLRELAEQSGQYDFGIVGLDSYLYCDINQSFQFQVRNPQWGTDNRWDETALEGVSFSIPRGNMDAPEYREIREALPTYLYLLGPSSGDEREVQEFPNAAAIDDSPWGRIEGVADAQGVDSSQAMLAMGWSELWLQGPKKEFDFQLLETSTCHYRAENPNVSCSHAAAFGLGDIVTASFSGVRADCKINQVSIHAGEGDPVYSTRMVIEVLSIETDTPDQYMLLGSGFPHVGNLGGIWRSTPSVAWTLQATLAGGYEEPKTLLRTQNGVVLAGTRWEGAVWYSEDEGLSWTKAQNITGEKEVMCMVEVSATGTLLLGTARDAEVWRSTDGGYTWTLAQTLETGFGDNYIYTLVEAPDGAILAGGIYPNVASDAEVWRSTNDGVTWTKVATLAGANYIVSMAVAQNGYIVAGTDGGFGDGEFWRSTDNGLTWTYIQDCTGNSAIYKLLSLPDGNLIAGTYDWGAQVEIWRSTDYGASWSLISLVDNTLDVCYALALDHENAIIGGFKPAVWGDDAELWRSIDGGVSWVRQLVVTGYQFPPALLRVGEVNAT